MTTKLPVLLAAVFVLALSALPAAASPVTITDQGRSLAAEWRTAPGRPATAPTVILVGDGADAPTTATFIGLLNDRGMHALALADQDIGPWMAWLKGQGAGGVVLLGHGQGAASVLGYAADHDDPRLTALVLLAPQAGLSPTLLSTVVRPVLVVAPAADPATPEVERLMQSIDSIVVEFVVLAGADHSLLGEHAPDVADAVAGLTKD